MTTDVIGRIEEALRNCGVSFISGECQLLAWAKSTSKDGPKVKLMLPDDEDITPFQVATVKKGQQTGQRYRYVLIELDDDELPLDTPEPAQEAPPDPQKPYGKAASELYRSGFFYVPEVLKEIGTDEEFLAWVRQQPCAMTGTFDYHKDEATGTVRQQCEAAHVSRIEYGRGVNHKPPYAAIPLVHFWHAAHHAHGERVFDTTDRALPNRQGDHEKGRAWMEKKRNASLMRWASHRLAEILGAHANARYDSIGQVPPKVLINWGEKHALAKYLPRDYVIAAKTLESTV